MVINLTKAAYAGSKQAKTVGNLHNYLIKNGLTSTPNRGVKTENINSCTAGVLNAGRKNFMFHSAPELQPIELIKKELEKQVNTLRETCDTVRGFIVGGLELNPKDKETVRSFDLYNKIADTLDELGVPFTMMCGKKKGAPLEGMYAVNDTITVWSDFFKNIFSPGNKKLQQDEIIQLLEKNYQFVEVSPEQKIQILDEAASGSMKSLVG